MTTWGRFLFGVLFLTGCLAGASAAQPELFARLGVGWLADTETANLTAELEVRAKLDYRVEVKRRRAAALRIIAGQLIDGQLTLLQAAALFGDLNDTPDDCKYSYLEVFPGSSAGEKLCRQVIVYVRMVLGEHLGSYPEMLVERLEAELTDLLAVDGTIHLPEE